MRRRFTLALLSAAAVCMAGPAPAADSTKTLSAEEVAANVRLLNSFSRCVARMSPRTAERILSLPLLSPEQTARVVRDVDAFGSCDGYTQGVLTRTPRALVSGLAEQMFLQGHAGSDAGILVAASTAKPRNLTEDLALCVVRRNPIAARALINTVPASGEEWSAARLLAPDLGACAPKDATLRLDGLSIRTYVAAGLYLATHDHG
jgi:hypothetical protein